jgi:radical SAM superfamily enzyme with C-terminal helix-hairpin-helix motif
MRWLQIKDVNSKHPVVEPFVWPTPKYSYRVVRMDAPESTDKVNEYAADGYRVVYTFGYYRDFMLMEKETYE